MQYYVLPRPPQYKSGVSTRLRSWSNRWRFSCHSYLQTRRNRQAWLRQKTADSLIYHSWFIGKDNSCDRASRLGKLNWSRTRESKHRRRVPHGQGGATDLVRPAVYTRNEVLIKVHITELETQTRRYTCTLRSSAPCYVVNSLHESAIFGLRPQKNVRELFHTIVTILPRPVALFTNLFHDNFIFYLTYL